MPDFWQFPTVSMGLGPMAAIYQARFNRYLAARGIADTSAARVWAFLGDGEMDEPEAVGALSLAAREGLDNLTFVVNCNLQRLDGPVRGNGKIIQELEAVFRGAGWNVIKVIWAREWDDLLARDKDGVLLNKMNETLDGDYQRMAVSDGATIREQFFGPDPRLRALVEHLTDDDLAKLRRGGHDYRKVYAAYAAAVAHTGAPTVILAKTVKGWTLGPGIEGRNVTHQAKKLTDGRAEDLPRPARAADPRRASSRRRRTTTPARMRPRSSTCSSAARPARRRRAVAAGTCAKPLPAPDGRRRSPSSSPAPIGRRARRWPSAGWSRNLVRDPQIGKRIVPIIPDEARTFGMDPLFKEVGIYNPLGQRYTPVDKELLLSYIEKADGQLLEEGITEAGSMASFQAAGTAYATWSEPMVPFYTFYSMFGLQRTGDQVWAFGDARGRGFMMGATAGRTTLTGEGLQHDDGHSHVLASDDPEHPRLRPGLRLRAGDHRPRGHRPHVRRARRGRLLLHHDLQRELGRSRPRPRASRRASCAASTGSAPPRPAAGRVQLLASGPILQQALRAQQMLAEKFDVAADVWSATSFQQLRNDALDVERWNRLHPDQEQRVRLRARSASVPSQGPIVAATDYLKAVPDMVARWIDRPYTVLGTDGFGRSDTREALRTHFEVNAEHIAYAALYGLCLDGASTPDELKRAIAELGIDPERVNPLHA